MLSVKTTENLAGVTVSGTYWDLNALYDALTNVIGEEESYPEFEACRIRVLGLCYDMKRYYNNFCTQWVDIQNVKYLKRAPEKRKTYLATISEKILFDNSDYDALEDGVYEFARVCGVPYYEIELTDIQYPDEIEW